MGGAGMRRPAILTVLLKYEDGAELKAVAEKGAAVTVRPPSQLHSELHSALGV